MSVEYSSGSGYHKLSTSIDYLNFQPKSSTFSKNISEALSELLVSSFISSKPRQHSVVSKCTSVDRKMERQYKELFVQARWFINTLTRE